MEVVPGIRAGGFAGRTEPWRNLNSQTEQFLFFLRRGVHPPVAGGLGGRAKQREVGFETAVK